MEPQASAEVRIETPFPLYAVPRVWGWIEAARNSVADDFGPTTPEEFLEHWRRRSCVERRYAVYRGDQVGGLITVEPASPHAAAVHCLFSKAFLGRDTTLEGLKLVLREIFDAGLQKITCSLFAHNAQVIALAKAIGAEREGKLIGQTMQHGKPVDVLIFGLSKEKFIACHGQWQSQQSLVE